MKIQEEGYYERYWRKEMEDASFGDVPVWGNVKALNALLDFFKPGIKGKILDAGCGEGDWVFHLAKFIQVKEVIGVDIAESAIKECLKKAKAKKAHKKVKFINSPITDLPFKNNYFDNIFSLEVLEHILDIDKTLSEFNRVVRKGGYVGVLTTDFNLLKTIVIGTFFFGKYFDPRSPHIRFFTKTTLKKIFEDHGFKLTNYKWTSSYFGIMPLAQLMLVQKVKNE